MKLELKDISKSYKEKKVLDGISVCLENGVYGLLGANGAGKTTLMSIITGNLKADGGEILYNGKAVNPLTDHDYLSHIGYLPQKMEYYEQFSGFDFLSYVCLLKGGNRKNTEEIKALLNAVHLDDVADRKIGTYSGGMKQRVGIAQAFLCSPELIILDEPTVGLDLNERKSFKEMIRETGKSATVILSTHIVSDVEEVADKVIYIKDGKLTNDSL